MKKDMMNREVTKSMTLEWANWPNKIHVGDLN
jgi:hypothetical protein